MKPSKPPDVVDPGCRSRRRAFDRRRSAGAAAAISIVVIAASALTSSCLIVEAFASLLSVWETSRIDQPGQLSFFNSKMSGGFFGLPVEVGDFDADGLPDLVVAPMAAPAGPQSDRACAGEVYVLRGNGRIGGIVDRAAFSDGSFPGLTIWGAREVDFLGTELYSADVNGDGIQDLIIGAENYDGPDGSRPNCGGVFIVLGRPGLLDDGSTIDLAFDPGSPPEGVITLVGERAGDRLGIWVEAGDLDGDGILDLLLGADLSPGAVPGPDRSFVGMCAAVYGRQQFPPILDLALGPEALPGTSYIYGRDSLDHFGSTLHARDLDGDGRCELIASAAINRLSAIVVDTCDFELRGADLERGVGGGDGPDGMRVDAGEVTVIFSGESGAASRLPLRIDLSSPPPELAGRISVIHGKHAESVAGEELVAGDLDGDGSLDLILGALAAPGRDGAFRAGAVYVIYTARLLKGRDLDLAATGPLPVGLTISELSGTERLEIFGDTLSVGDLNHDGFDDLAIGIPHAEVDGRVETGRVVVAFGRRERLPEVFYPNLGDVPSGPPLAFINGGDRGDLLSYSMEIRDYDLDGYGDLFPNAMHGDGNSNLRPQAGEAYLVSGFLLTGQTVKLDAIEPWGGPLEARSRVTLYGSGFTTARDTRVQVGGAEAAELEVLSGSRLLATFPPGAALGAVPVTLRNVHGESTIESGFTYFGSDPFLRGDGDGSGALSIADASATLGYLFLGDPGRCLDRHDADDDGRVLINDPVLVLSFLFLGGRPPAAPFPEAGPDSTADGLGCP